MFKLKEFIKEDKLNWQWLSKNPNAIHILEQNMYEVNWCCLSTNPNAIDILELNPDKISWFSLSRNPSIFELDYKGLKERCSVYKEELICKAFHPSRISRYLDMGIEIEDLDDYIL